MKTNSIWQLTQAALLSLTVMVPNHRAGAAGDADLFVDFRYTPQWWVTSICLPDDPHKTVVGRSGELLYHYAGRFYDFKVNVGFQTTVGLIVSEDARWVRQELESARVPIVKTYRESPTLKICEEAFAVTGSLTADSAPRTEVRRVDAGGVLADWAQPPPGTSPALASAAVSTHVFPPRKRTIRYAVNVAPGESRKIALAVCEGHYEIRSRSMEMNVEGAPARKVDAGGEVGKNKPVAFWFDARDANQDGQISIEVLPAPGATDKFVVLNGLWVFPAETPSDSAALLAGKLDAQASAAIYGGRQQLRPRNDVILVHVTNTSTNSRTISPELVVRSERPVRTDIAEQKIAIHGQEIIHSSLRMQGVRQFHPQKRVVQLEPLTIAPGQTADFHVLYAAGTPVVLRPQNLAEAKQLRAQAADFWNQAKLPFGKVEVPDKQIQSLVDSSIRNIWQAREIKGGLPSFQVGPAVYRGLWVVDGAFMLEAAAMLGAVDEARAGINYMLSHQNANGSFEVLEKYYKENGIVLWMCVQHARLTSDRAWLEGVWPKLEKTVAYIRELRRLSRTNPQWLCQGLIPPGFVDGGVALSEKGDYSNVYWNLGGLKAAIAAATWLGKAAEAAEWQKEYDDFEAAFQTTARRDLRQDPNGNTYLPDMMGNVGNLAPQRGQWAFFHGVYPGKVFASNDPILTGTMAMFESCEQQGGMIVGDAGLVEGIWGYLASFHAHAWLWLGNGRKAAERLYAFANHASPLLAWREEQMPVGEHDPRDFGDMPHNWAGAEFIRLVRDLLVLERGDELHLLEGLPAGWI
ncbi:MAG: hypothetical protein WCS99_15000, partial [Limisphaerales bacterium]